MTVRRTCSTLAVDGFAGTGNPAGTRSSAIITPQPKATAKYGCGPETEKRDQKMWHILVLYLLHFLHGSLFLWHPGHVSLNPVPVGTAPGAPHCTPTLCH